MCFIIFEPLSLSSFFFFFQAEDGIRDRDVTGVQTCALPISPTWPWGGDKDWHPHEPQHWSQLVAMMPYTEILFKPGSKFSYSNPGIIFLGRVIELITKDDYEVYIDKNIFKPLEMYRAYFDTTPRHLLQHLSHSYYLKEGKLTPARFDV